MLKFLWVPLGLIQRFCRNELCFLIVNELKKLKIVLNNWASRLRADLQSEGTSMITIRKHVFSQTLITFPCRLQPCLKENYSTAMRTDAVVANCLVRGQTKLIALAFVATFAIHSQTLRSKPLPTFSNDFHQFSIWCFCNAPNLKIEFLRLTIFVRDFCKTFTNECNDFKRANCFVWSEFLNGRFAEIK